MYRDQGDRKQTARGVYSMQILKIHGEHYLAHEKQRKQTQKPTMNYKINSLWEDKFTNILATIFLENG